MKPTYQYYTDPGHGWLKVSRKELVKLGIASSITSYSYQRGESVYLEEDCDMATFLNALKSAGVEPVIKYHSTDRSSRIRGYEQFRHLADIVPPLLELISEGRWLVRLANGNRLGEVFGINGRYQAQSMRGILVGNAQTLNLAASLLVEASKLFVVATVHDPASVRGEGQEPVHQQVVHNHDDALNLAAKWVHGYFVSVYQAQGESIYNFAPKGGV